jgi:cell division septation protein DedD
VRARAIVPFAALLLTSAVTRPAKAQSNPAVRGAIQLAAEGRGDSAYRVVNAELARARPGDTTWVEALYWRGRLATYGDSAERDFRRVAIEYSGSSWADDALLQLSQLALAAGNPASAYELAGRLRSDYPDSDLRAQAALWSARAAFEIGEPRSACALLDSAAAEGRGNVEYVNQVTFYKSRCTAAVLAAPPRDTARPVPSAGDTTARTAAVPTDSAHPGASGRFEVQVAAATSDRAARDVADRLTRAGLRAKVVPGDGGVRRVRLGPYANQAQADSALRAAQRIVGGAPFLVRVP